MPRKRKSAPDNPNTNEKKVLEKDTNISVLVKKDEAIKAEQETEAIFCKPVQENPKIIVEFDGSKYPKFSFENQGKLLPRHFRTLSVVGWQELQKFRKKIIHSTK